MRGASAFGNVWAEGSFARGGSLASEGLVLSSCALDAAKLARDGSLPRPFSAQVQGQLAGLAQ